MTRRTGVVLAVFAAVVVSGATVAFLARPSAAPVTEDRHPAEVLGAYEPVYLPAYKDAVEEYLTNNLGPRLRAGPGVSPEGEKQVLDQMRKRYLGLGWSLHLRADGTCTGRGRDLFPGAGSGDVVGRWRFDHRDAAVYLDELKLAPSERKPPRRKFSCGVRRLEVHDGDLLFDLRPGITVRMRRVGPVVKDG